jgi:hypothetical protein
MASIFGRRGGWEVVRRDILLYCWSMLMLYEALRQADVIDE